MPRFAINYIVLFCIFNFASPYDIFWSSTENGINVIDKAFVIKGKNLLDVERIAAGLSSLAWGFTVDETSSESATKMGFKTKSAALISQTLTIKKLRRIGNHLYGNSSLITLEGRMVERGDFDPVIRKCEHHSSSFRVIVVLTKNWTKNDYGEISIYDKNQELIKSIHPKYGRAIFLPCEMEFKISPPSINVEMRHYFLFAEFANHKSNNSATDVEAVDAGPLASLSSYLKEKVDFDASNYMNIIPESYIKRKFYTSKGNKIFVFDNAIPKILVDGVKNFITNHADYFEEPVIDEASADNVKWIISLDEPGFQDLPLWLIMKQLLRHVAGKDFFPYDTSCNHIRRTDTTFVHKDIYTNGPVEDDGAEYTVLLYLNSNLNENDYGETGFYENEEVVAAVLPKYGRVVVFDGEIDHSAHPSSPTLAGARYTLAIKTAPSIKLAMERFLLNDGVSNYTGFLEMAKKLKDQGDPSQVALADDFLTKLYSGKLGNNDAIFLAQQLQINITEK